MFKKKQKQEEPKKEKKPAAPKKSFKEKKSEFQNRLKNKSQSIKAFLDLAAMGEQTTNQILHRIINAIKVGIVSTRKFMIDDCLTKASSTAYTVIVSLIPTLTVALTFYSIFSGAGEKKDELFRRISLFMLEHNMKINIDPVFAAISGLVENAGKIGGIGAVIMIFSATAMLRSLEKSLNDIFRVQKARPFVLKIIFYWAALTLGPVMLIAGTTVASQVTAIFSAPHYNSAYMSQEKNLWIVGNKASILHSKDGSLKFKKIKIEQFDFDNQKVYEYERSTSSFSEKDIRLEALDFKSRKYLDIQFIGKSGWVIGDDGIVLNTTDGGKNWNLRKWGSFSFNDIHMVSRTNGFIACNNGRLLKTIDGGKTWQIQEWQNVTANFLSISFYGTKGIITGSRGIILTTDDGGAKWTLNEISNAKRKGKLVDLNCVDFVDRNNIWIAGNEGINLFSSNGGGTWRVKKFKEYNYQSALFYSPKKGYLAGTSGIVIYTEDGGESWTPKTLPTYKINKLLNSNGEVWAIGDTGTIMISKNDIENWKGKEGKSFIAFVINFFAPFVFIWLLFALAYISLPNIKVPFKYASIGAAFTGAVWVLFILLFIFYVKSFAKGTFAIYGALASIPLFLLMVYTSIVIVLYGAEVSYTLMHPATYGNLKKALKQKHEIQVYHGIAILHYIYKKFETGKGTTSSKEIEKVTNNKDDEVDFYLKLFINANLIIAKGTDDYIPANASKNIYINELIDIIYDKNFDISGAANNLKNELKDLFNSITESRKKIMGELTLEDLVKKA